MMDKFSFKKGYRARALFLIFDYLFLIFNMCIMIIPLLKTFVDSVDPTTYGLRLWPKVVDFSAYQKILSTTSLFSPLMVSIFTTLVGTLVGLLLTTLAGYVIIQKAMPGHKFITNMIFFTMLFNGGLIPTYLTIKNLGLMNNMIAVIVPCSLSAYNIILMKSFFETIPTTLYEAAALDGVKNRFQEMWYITIPTMKPQMLFGAVMAIVGTFQNGLIGVQLSGANPTPNYAAQLIVNHIEDYGFIRYEMGYAAAVSVVLLGIVWTFSKISKKLFQEKD